MRIFKWHYLGLLASLGWLSSLVTLGTSYNDLTSLEKRVVDKGLKRYGLRPVADPLSKVVKEIFILTESPFDEGAGFFTIFNSIHINSRERVIRGFVLQKTNAVYDPSAVRDSEYLLRSLRAVRCLAVIIPVERLGDTDDSRVSLLVATRDIFSLQPSFDFSGFGKTLTELTLGIGVHNLFGYNKSLDATYDLDQATHSFSLRYFDPELFSSPLRLTLAPSLLFNRDGFGYAGLKGRFKLERPLLFEADPFGYGIDLSYGSIPIVDFSGAHVREVEIPMSDGLHRFLHRYRWRYGNNLLHGRYSMGRTYKKEISFGYGLNIKKPAIPKGLELTRAERAVFIEKVLPKDEVESFVTVGFDYFHNHFLTLSDLNTYNLQENIRLGPYFQISSDLASSHVLFSTHSFIRARMKYSFVQKLYKDSFISISMSSADRYDGQFSDDVYKFGANYSSHRLAGLGRLIMDLRLSTSYGNRDNNRFVLGSGSGVRGVESRFYSGEKGFRANFEFRSSPIELLMFNAGLVLFYDVGAAFDRFADANATHALGLGFRVLAPQVSSIPFRFDLAFPIYGVGRKYHAVVPSFGSGQAF